MANNVSIATRPLVYSAFRYINNKVWNALAEYVDNSLQSYLNHRNILAPLNSNGMLNVYIDIDVDNDVITIKDDAFGIDEANYGRAFELANIPLDAEGLNEFGMGMKVSSIWLSDYWKVESSAYGENVKKTFTFDLKEVVSKEETELPVLEEFAGDSDHYTIVTLNQLTHNKPSNRSLSYIKKHLASIYTKFIREGVLNLVVNGEVMKYEELSCLNVPYYKTPKDKPVLWKREIFFEAPKPNGKEKYVVKGFIGLLETMSTNNDNGFLLFRRDRVIGTSYDDKYRPEELCGQVGSPRYKRVYGELYLEGFDVSFTKNSFQEDDDLKTFIGLLKEDIAGSSDFDLFGQAQYYTKPKTIQQKTDVGKTLIKKIAQDFSKPIKVASTTNAYSDTSNLNTKNEDNSKTNGSSKNNDKNNISIAPIKTNVQFADGKIIEITFKCEYASNPYELYSLVGNDGRYTSVINLHNPFFEQFGDTLSKPDGISQIAYIIKTMIASEVRLTESGNLSGGVFRNEFNKLIGTL